MGFLDTFFTLLSSISTMSRNNTVHRLEIETIYPVNVF